MKLHGLKRSFLVFGVLGCLNGMAWADSPLTISSPAFAPGQAIPAKHSNAKENISPALKIAGIPFNTRSLALIVDDPDSPAGLWTHWLVWNLPADTALIPEGSLPKDARVGKNSFGDAYYDGPAPPSGTHRYFFHLYALDTKLSLKAGAPRAALLKAMDGHIVGTAEIFGTYTAP